MSVTLQGVSDGYKHGASSFFAMYRFDFMLDQQLRPYIMEVMYFCIVTPGSVLLQMQSRSMAIAVLVVGN